LFIYCLMGKINAWQRVYPVQSLRMKEEEKKTRELSEVIILCRGHLSSILKIQMSFHSLIVEARTILVLSENEVCKRDN
jgi:hypothetical protein